jgi:hypothetical protein
MGQVKDGYHLLMPHSRRNVAVQYMAALQRALSHLDRLRMPGPNRLSRENERSLEMVVKK